MLSARPRYQQFIVVGALLAVFLLFYLPSRSPSPASPPHKTHLDAGPSLENPTAHEQKPDPISVPHTPSGPRCPDIPGADKVLVVLKTGGTESQKRIPVHLSTDLRCIPHFRIYSDLAEEINGIQIHDALDQVDSAYRIAHDDFEHYRLLEQYRREGKDIAELVPAAGSKKEDASAWKLDKWKFLPLVVKATRDKPDAEWYVFVEADIYLVWGTLLHYLSQFDSVKDQDWYIGGQNWMGGIEFGNGGSGYIMSRSAAHKFAALVSADPAKYEDMTDNDCCGDLLIAKVFQELGIALTRAWPILQGETPSSLDYTRHHWCHPVVTYHHMSGKEMGEYFDFEQVWLRSENGTHAIMHRDAFTHFVEPNVQQPRTAWDNLSQDKTFHPSTSAAEASDVDQGAHLSFANCEAACLANPQCLQYSFLDEFCYHGHVIRLGHAAATKQESGWMHERIAQFKQEQEPCLPRWITQNDS